MIRHIRIALLALGPDVEGSAVSVAGQGVSGAGGSFGGGGASGSW
jgi:uncharacterized membrane protein YgcG